MKAHVTPLVGIFVAIVAVISLAVIIDDQGLAAGPCKPCPVPENEWDKLPPNKRAELERLKRDYEEAINRAPPAGNATSTKGAVPPTTSALKSWPKGIFESEQAPICKRYVVKNRWQSDRGGKHVQIYAGNLAADPSQGLVVVLTTSADLASRTVTEHLTPRNAGPVRIVDASASHLTLVSALGSMWTFDIETLKFQDSLPPVGWPSGTFALGEARFPAGQPFPANLLDISNVWQGRIGSEYVRVFAGAYLGDPSQGVVLVQRVSEDLWHAPTPGALKAAPVKSGALRVVSVVDGRVTLSSASGLALDFDIATQTFSPR